MGAAAPGPAVLRGPQVLEIANQYTNPSWWTPEFITRDAMHSTVFTIILAPLF